MTKKDYVLIAGAISQELDFVVDDPRATEAIKSTAQSLATKLAVTNATFNREKFLEACGMGETRWITF